MKRVVIIDDEPESLEIMQEIFEAYTCRVFTATTGKQGLKLAEETKPDLVFLDLKLPDISGEKILPQIKAQSPKTKVIVGTAYGDPETKERLLKGGADGFFDKPMNVNVFEKKVRQLIGPLSEIRILLIDDELEFCLALKEILESDSDTHWEIKFATSGEEGLKLAKEFLPDLISLDICLNVKGDASKFSSGLGVWRELKKQGFKIPVIVLAAYIDSSEAEEFRKEGLGMLFSKTDLLSSENLTHFLNVLKRIALRGSLGQVPLPKVRGSVS